MAHYRLYKAKDTRDNKYGFWLMRGDEKDKPTEVAQTHDKEKPSDIKRRTLQGRNALVYAPLDRWYRFAVDATIVDIWETPV